MIKIRYKANFYYWRTKSTLQVLFSREAWEALGSQGLLGVNIPAEVGGIGGSFIDEMIVAEEMSYNGCTAPAMALHSTIVMPYLAHYGTRNKLSSIINFVF